MKHTLQTFVVAALAGSTPLLVLAHEGTHGSSATESHSAAMQSDAQMQGKKITLDQLPQQAKQTILQHTGGIAPNDLRMVMRDGKQCYTAAFKQGRAISKVTVDRDGSIVALQDSAVFAADVDLPKLQQSQMRFDQLPQPVQQTFKKEAGTAQIGHVSKSEVNGKPIYRADFNREGIRHELFVNQQGQVAAQVREVTVASQWTFDENGNLVANPNRAINEAAGAQAPSHDKDEE